MKTILFALGALFAPHLAAAGPASVNADIVRGCFENTAVGVAYPDCLGDASNACQGQPGGSSTLGIARCIEAETAVWDTILNEEYHATQAQNTKADVSEGEPLINRTDFLRNAQRAWIAFRDAECRARYAMWQDGTLRNIVSASCHLTMTAARTIDLRDMRGE